MKVVKIIRQEYEVENVVDKPFAKFGMFRKIRERFGLSIQRQCFSCGRKFKDDEDIYLATFIGTLNHFLCKSCNDKALEDLRNEETV